MKLGSIPLIKACGREVRLLFWGKYTLNLFLYFVVSSIFFNLFVFIFYFVVLLCFELWWLIICTPVFVSGAILRTFFTHTGEDVSRNTSVGLIVGRWKYINMFFEGHSGVPGRSLFFQVRKADHPAWLILCVSPNYKKRHYYIKHFLSNPHQKGTFAEPVSCCLRFNLPAAEDEAGRASLGKIHHSSHTCACRTVVRHH